MIMSTYGRQNWNHKVNNILKLQCKYELKSIKQAVNTCFHFKILKWNIDLSVEEFLKLLEDTFLTKFLELQS